MIETYKTMNGIYDDKVVPKLELRNNPNLRGHSQALKKTRSSKKLRANLFTKSIVNTRNCLPETFVSALSVNPFKTRLDLCWEKEDVKYKFKVSLSARKKLFDTDYLELDTEDLRNLNQDTSQGKVRYMPPKKHCISVKYHLSSLKVK